MSALPADAPAEMFRAALDALPTPVFVYDDERVLYANGAACAMIGAESAADIPGMSVKGFVLPGFDDISNQRRRYVINGGIHLRNLVIKVRALDGEPTTLRVDIQQLRFGGQTAAMATLSNPEASRSTKPSPHLADEPVTVHEAVLRALELPLLIHGDSTIFFANPAALEKFHAADASQLIGADITTIVHPDAVLAGQERRKLPLEPNQVLREVPLKLRTIDGRTVYAVGDAQRIAWDGGRAILITARFNDADS